MSDCDLCKTNKKTIYRTLLRGVCWFSSILVFAILLTACGGGGEDVTPPLTSAASLMGRVTFTANVPLAEPPNDAFDGPVPWGVRYGARIIDPGDDIGGTPIPKPTNMSSTTGDYEFRELNPDPMSYLNLRFTVDANLENNGSTRTPVSFNIPISLAKAIQSVLSVNIDRPSENALQMVYTYRGPDGAREVRLRLDFVTDLLTFDLDSDGLFDDLIAIDYNHDAIADEQAPVVERFDYTTARTTIGTAGVVASSTISVSGVLYDVWASSNITNTYNLTPLSLAEVGVGQNITVGYIDYTSGKVAVNILVQPNPSTPNTPFDVTREGAIEEITSTTIFVGGILFENYQNALIENVLGDKFPPSGLNVGKYVTVTGSRVGSVVTAKHIVVKEVTPPPSYIERHGIINALSPQNNPTLMTVEGVDFQIAGQTVIKDLSKQNVDSSCLIVGNPVHVLGHLNGGVYTANVIELQYVIDTKPSVPQIVVLISDTDATGAVNAALMALAVSTAAVTVNIASYPPAQTEPDCILDVFDELMWSVYLLKGLPGYIDAFPRSENDQCEIMVLIEDNYPKTREWVDFFFPNGIGGAPLIYDNVARPPYYGIGPDLAIALEEADQLEALLAGNSDVVGVYVSPDIGFSE